MARTYKDKRKFNRKEKELSYDESPPPRFRKNKNLENLPLENSNDCPNCYGDNSAVCGYCGNRAGDFYYDITDEGE